MLPGVRLEYELAGTAGAPRLLLISGSGSRTCGASPARTTIRRWPSGSRSWPTTTGGWPVLGARRPAPGADDGGLRGRRHRPAGPRGLGRLPRPRACPSAAWSPRSWPSPPPNASSASAWPARHREGPAARRLPCTPWPTCPADERLAQQVAWLDTRTVEDPELRAVWTEAMAALAGQPADRRRAAPTAGPVPPRRVEPAPAPGPTGPDRRRTLRRHRPSRQPGGTRSVRSRARISIGSTGATASSSRTAPPCPPSPTGWRPAESGPRTRSNASGGASWRPKRGRGVSPCRGRASGRRGWASRRRRRGRRSRT